MLRNTTGHYLIIALLVSSILPALAQADDPAVAQRAEPTWQFEFTPYLWAAGLSGTTRIDGRPEAGLGVDQSFSDILSHLNAAAMGLFEVRHGQWGLLADALYVKVGQTGGVSGAMGFLSLTASAQVTQEVYSLGGAYRLDDTVDPIDLIVGFRYGAVKGDVSISISSPPVPVPNQRFVNTKDWVDPVIGIRIQHPLTQRWSLTGYADVGGFGVGSRRSWQAVAGANYKFNERLVGKLGYRYLSFDYEDRNFYWKVADSGPCAGLGIRW